MFWLQVSALQLQILEHEVMVYCFATACRSCVQLFPYSQAHYFHSYYLDTLTDLCVALSFHQASLLFTLKQENLHPRCGAKRSCAKALAQKHRCMWCSVQWCRWGFWQWYNCSCKKCCRLLSRASKLLLVLNMSCQKCTVVDWPWPPPCASSNWWDQACCFWVLSQMKVQTKLYQ